jgi:hypothetical protein
MPAACSCDRRKDAEMIANFRRSAALAALALLALLPLAGSATGAAHLPQRRQLAVTTLSGFKVVLTATRVSRLDATAINLC